MDIYKETKTKTEELYTILKELKSNQLSFDKVCKAMEEIERGFIKNSRNEEMLFYSFDDPSTMPSDARVELAYEPTYLACGVMMYAAFRNPELLDEKKFSTTLHDGLNACTGRRFLGHGFDEVEGFLKAMTIFADCNAIDFVKQFPEFNENFTNLFHEAGAFLKSDICSGKVKNVWIDCDYVGIATTIYKKLTHTQEGKSMTIEL